MANTWRVGQFGLTSFDDHNLSLSDLIQHFNDDINNNFTDIPVPDGKVDLAVFTNIPTPDGNVDEPTYTMVPQPLGKVAEPGYTKVPDSNVPSFTNIPLPDGKVDEPIYEDRIKNT
tara:strand:- start:1458 stop:1805 length:348 start_codon:yes stop_codon:yes gene_type:complete